uniref:Uncharacterized protein n=1 Tax=Anguilla anguilla TaxID=7936 RepID=A0A0E9RK98_ANGAN
MRLSTVGYTSEPLSALCLYGYIFSYVINRTATPCVSLSLKRGGCLTGKMVYEKVLCKL